MNIDGVNSLACIKSHTDFERFKYLSISHLKVVKDLIGDLTTLYKQYESIQPLKVDQTREEKTELKQLKRKRKLDGHYDAFMFVVPLHAQAIGGMEINI